MNLLKRIWQRFFGAVKARYEAAYQRWGERSWLPSTVQDARFDSDQYTRIELCRRHRYWVRNNGLIHRIRNLFIQFSVGVNGLECVPNSGDETWNEARKLSWDRWGQSPELSSELTMAQLQIMWSGALFDDGEVFIQKTVKGHRPALITIEAHRVQTPPDM